MRINESRLKQIIAEEMAALEDKQQLDHVDEEGGMAKSQLYNLAKYAIMLHDALEDEQQLEGWVQSKITLATDYIGKVKHYLEYELGLKMEEPDLAVDYEESEPDEYDLDDEDDYLIET
jgi:hypothetical protein